MKKILQLVGATFLTLMLTSCESLESALQMNIRPHEPKFTISLNSIVKHPRGLDMEKSITTIKGERVTVNINSFIDSAMIMDAVAMQRQDDPLSYDMSLKLNQTGLKMWFQLVIDARDEPTAVLIDGAYFGRFVPDDGHSEDTEWVTLKGPFNEVVASGIEKFVKRNYRELNPTASGF